MSFADLWLVLMLIVIVSFTVLFSIIWTQWSSVSFVLFEDFGFLFLFESASTFPTGPSPLKEHEVWLFLVHVLFVCFFLFSLVLLHSGLYSFSLDFFMHLIWGSGLMDLSVGEKWSWACSWGMHWQICLQSVESVRLFTLHQFAFPGTKMLVN